MKTPLLFTIVVAVSFTAATMFAQESSPSPATGAPSAAGQPNEAEMMKQMMEMAKTNENHKLLASLDGTWDYTVKMWMNGDPTSKPDLSKGTAVRKSVMDGRYVEMNVSGKMDMPGADGKMKTIDFKGMGLEGYDNAKKKFVGTWMDNMGTGILLSEGDYDPATKTFTYIGEMEMLPGMKQKVRETMKVPDKDHMEFEWYEDRGGKEAKTVEINYTRRK
ncbi:MAG: DUF1579 domain-containing protein [Chthoniobacterales bacterium]